MAGHPDAPAESHRCPDGRKGSIQMDERLGRREFLGAAGTLAPLVQGVLSAQGVETPARTTPYRRVAIEPFDYSGVRLRPSFWQRQATAGRDYYLGVSNDDILHGYRVAAGTADAPGRALGGWCSPNSNTVFGQWLQSMARMQRAYGDKELLEKANTLVSEYVKCWPGMSRGAARSSGRAAAGGPTAGLGHYAYEKLVGGLTDMHSYAGHSEALPLCDKITEAAVANFNRERVPANRQPWELHSGRSGRMVHAGREPVSGVPAHGQFDV